jgi:putative component of membrane protein insertase Oxa1/YidC/SpoIIIJ protein YidD
MIIKCSLHLRLTLVVLIFLCCNSLLGQTKVDSVFLNTTGNIAIKPKPILSPWPKKARFSSYAIYIPYWFYKQFISSQDGMSCSFTPSCANYAMETAKKRGAVLGVLLGLDRITRCHNLDFDHYEIDPQTGRWSDIPMNHR